MSAEGRGVIDGKLRPPRKKELFMEGGIIPKIQAGRTAAQLRLP